MQNVWRLMAVGLAQLVAAIAVSETGTIRLSSFPGTGIADARSSLTITAEVRDNSGRIVPDGTQVVFQTTLGTLRQSAVGTSSGSARAVLLAPGSPGFAKVTATAIQYGATATLDIEFFSPAEALKRTGDHIEVVALKHLRFSMDYGILEAAGPNKGVSLRYRGIELQADDVQVNLAYQELRARRAKLQVGGKARQYDELYLKLDTRGGLGTTTYETQVITGFMPEGRWVRAITATRSRQGVVEVLPNGEVQAVAHGFSAGTKFDFEDISASSTVIAASKVVVYPQRELQFQRAQIIVDGATAMRLPLYQVSLRPGAPSTLGEQIFTFNDSRLGIDYPHYLSLKPGETSLLRFRTGQRYGRTVSGSGGAFLDYELNWNSGDALQGGLVVSGLTRPDWSVDANQYMRFGDGSTLTALLSSPAHRSLFGSINYSKPLNGYSLSLSGSGTRSLIGPSTGGETLSLILEKDPVRIKGTPISLHLGLTAADQRFRSPGRTDVSRSIGARLRGQLDAISLSPSTRLNGSFSINQLWATGRNDGLSYQATASLRHDFGRTGSLGLGYDILGGDSLESFATGKQRLSFEGAYSDGRARLNVFGSQSLDADWSTLYADGSYRLSGLFRLSSSYTLDKYLRDSRLEYNYTLWYRLGVREVGLTWSSRSKRLGIQFLGAGFN